MVDKNGKNEELLPINKAAQLLGVSIATLRRWDESGRFPAIRRSAGGDRYYRKSDVEIFLNDLPKLANDWILHETEFPQNFYCQLSGDFQARVIRMHDDLIRSGVSEDFASLITSLTGEIGNNSFDHNLGQWPDLPGVFFGFDMSKKQIVLADRGVGILQTLRRVKPELQNDIEALQVAFTQVISGRAPEGRGNGLKYVREVVSENLIALLFRSGNAELHMVGGQSDFKISENAFPFHGCFAFITY